MTIIEEAEKKIKELNINTDSVVIPIRIRLHMKALIDEDCKRNNMSINRFINMILREKYL